ncbi:hypothetical protein Tco_0942598 [Tanacetum coccineum]
MSEEDQHVDVAALPKFDMTSYESCMSAKDVKSLAIRHGIPLDLHPVALTKGRVILDVMAWRHHDSDVNDHVPKDGFSVLDVKTLTEQILRGMVILWRRPYHSRSDWSAYHSPLSTDQPISEKTDHQKEVEEEDPKIVAIKERKERAAAKKREKKKMGEDEGEGSRPKVKRRKTTAARKDHTGPVGGNPSGVAVETAESREDRSLHISPHDSANSSVHNYADAHGNKETDNLWLGSFVGQSERALTNVNIEVL